MLLDEYTSYGTRRTFSNFSKQEFVKRKRLKHLFCERVKMEYSRNNSNQKQHRPWQQRGRHNNNRNTSWAPKSSSFQKMDKDNNNTSTSIPPSKSEEHEPDISDKVSILLPKGSREAQNVLDTLFRITSSRGKFPGTLTSGVVRDNLKVLREQQKQYYISIKADGLRFLLLWTSKNLYLINRKLEVRKCVPPFFIPSNQDYETLLDGELVALNNSDELCFIVFDAVLISGKFVSSANLSGRLKAAEAEVNAFNSKHKDDTTTSNCRIQMQRFFPFTSLKNVFDNEMPQIKSNNWNVDGLVFTPENNNYRFGYNKNIVKWKPEEKTTIDFQLKPFVAHGKTWWQLYINSKTGLKFFGWLCEDENSKDNPSIRENSIVECVWDKDAITTHPEGDKIVEQKGGWRFQRERTDKSMPNADWVVEGIVSAIHDVIKQEDLLNLLE